VSQYVEGTNLIDMIRENLIAERIAVDHYRELIRYFGDDDPATRTVIEGILRWRKSTPTTCRTC
jgi:bacterioferritin